MRDGTCANRACRQCNANRPSVIRDVLQRADVRWLIGADVCDLGLQELRDIENAAKKGTKQ